MIEKIEVTHNLADAKLQGRLMRQLERLQDRHLPVTSFGRRKIHVQESGSIQLCISITTNGSPAFDALMIKLAALGFRSNSGNTDPAEREHYFHHNRHGSVLHGVGESIFNSGNDAFASLAQAGAKS